MVNPDCNGCPKCGTLKNLMTRRGVTRTDEHGLPKFAGFCDTCTCGALTYSPSSNQYNLKSEVAVEFGIMKMTDKVVVAVTPTVRRKVKVPLNHHNGVLIPPSAEPEPAAASSLLETGDAAYLQ